MRRRPSSLVFRGTAAAVVVVGAVVAQAAAAQVTSTASGEPRNVRATTATTPAWTTVFRDDFDGAAGTGLDGNWMYDIGTGYPGGAPQWGTGEIETASNSTANVYHDGAGHLVIKALRGAQGTWTSGRVETQRTDFMAPAGGELTIRASIKQPNPASGLGYWPAFWALGAAARPVSATNWPGVGELDIMEDVNALSQVSHTFHCGVWGQPPCNEPDGISSGLLACATCLIRYHTYSVTVDRRDATAEQLRFYTDGVEQYTVNSSQVSAATWTAAVDHGFFVILDLAVGGSYPDKVCACNSSAASPTPGAPMLVDYVAVQRLGPPTSGG